MPFFSSIYVRCLNMSQYSRENRLKRVRLTRLFVLKITIEYKVAETEKVDLDLFVVQYLSSKEIISTTALHVLLKS